MLTLKPNEADAINLPCLQFPRQDGMSEVEPWKGVTSLLIYPRFTDLNSVFFISSHQWKEFFYTGFSANLPICDLGKIVVSVAY